MKRRAKKTQNFPEKLAKAGWLLTGEKGVIQRVKMIFNRTFFFTKSQEIVLIVYRMDHISLRKIATCYGDRGFS